MPDPNRTPELPLHPEPTPVPLPAAKRAPATWALPPGVPRGVWDYAHSRDIATEYDATLAGDPLLELDQQLLDQVFTKPGRLVDFGCGSGRHLLRFAQRGFEKLGVDLSAEMLAVVRQKAAAAHLDIPLVQANLVELAGLRDAQADYALCLFSTLGMIRGQAQRRQALQHMRRILKPGGQLALHVHNIWSLARLPTGRGWLVQHAWEVARGQAEWGDKLAEYRGIPQFFLHFFTGGELRRELRQSGFRVQKWWPVTAQPVQLLPRPGLLSDLRAAGWVIIATAD